MCVTQEPLTTNNRTKLAPPPPRTHFAWPPQLPLSLSVVLQPVLMSTGHTPMYTSAVSTLVRAQHRVAFLLMAVCFRADIRPLNTFHLFCMWSSVSWWYQCAHNHLHSDLSDWCKPFDFNSSNFLKAVSITQPLRMRVGWTDAIYRQGMLKPLGVSVTLCRLTFLTLEKMTMLPSRWNLFMYRQVVI